MRNYVQLRGVKFLSTGSKLGFPNILTDIYAFGADDNDLMRTAIVNFNFFVSGANPSYSYAMSFPNAVVDWNLKLDKTNVLALVSISPGTFWNWTVTEPLNTNPPLKDLVAVNLSPRNSFPTDLGTDGQRLAANKNPKSSAGVLQFIARLYFLTSNPDLLAIFQKLKTGKLTPKKALDAAKLIARL